MRCRVVGPPAAKDIVSSYGFPRILIFKKCTMHIVLKAYETSLMGDAPSAPCCYSFTHDT